ncbi:MAG: putative glycoside hydrolase [Myxococcota bacterium]|nr:putative glycoside hydrolase [Myxococcota bacterium]MDW8363764.1 putative glycoside hydrolase [Myxococcales bacterium]
MRTIRFVRILRFGRVPIVLLAVSLVLAGVSSGGAQRPAAFAAGAGTDDPRIDPVSVRGQRARGVYVTGPFVRHHGLRGVLGLVRSTRTDAVVIDVKDGAGRVGHDTAIPELEPQQRGFLGDARALVAALREAGIYTIARVVCFADPQLPHRMPDRAILDARPNRQGRPWVSWGTGGTWLNPYDRRNHDMIVALAREVEALGFDELQLDYIRFPVDDGIRYAHFPGADDRPRWQVLRELLERIDLAIRIPLGVDVFGLVAFDFGRTDVLGQHVEQWTDVVEVISPMLYLHAMRNWGRGLEDRSARLVHAGISQLRGRLGAEPVIRPFLQSFPNSADNPDEQFILDQIRGARLGRADGYLFWHPGSNYALLRRAMQGPGRGESAFDLGDRPRARQARWSTRGADAERTVARRD